MGNALENAWQGAPTGLGSTPDPLIGMVTQAQNAYNAMAPISQMFSQSFSGVKMAAAPAPTVSGSRTL